MSATPTPTAAPAPVAVPEDQLLELLTQLKKTTPEQARAILNEQSQIGVALVQLMVKLDVVNVDVLQQTLTKFSTQASAPTLAGTQAQGLAPTPVPTIPPHLAQHYQHFHQATPPPALPPPPSPALAMPGAPTAPSQAATTSPLQLQSQTQAAYATLYMGTYAPTPPIQNGYAVSQPQPQYAYSGQQQQQQAPPPPQAATFLNAFSNVPDEQKEMIMRVISMTSGQVNSLPPQEREITVQLRATLGVPTE